MTRDDILNEFKAISATAWDQFTPSERDQIVQTATRVAELFILKAQGIDVTEALGLTQTTVALWKDSISLAVASAFWQAVLKASQIAGTFTAAFAKAAIASLIGA